MTYNCIHINFINYPKIEIIEVLSMSNFVKFNLILFPDETFGEFNLKLFFQILTECFKFNFSHFFFSVSPQKIELILSLVLW